MMGGVQRMGGVQKMAGRKRGGKFTTVPPRNVYKKGGAQYMAGAQKLGARKRGGGLFGSLKNAAIDAAAPIVTAEVNKRLKKTGVTVTQAQVKALLKNMKLSDIKSPKKALMKVLQILK